LGDATVTQHSIMSKQNPGGPTHPPTHTHAPQRISPPARPAARARVWLTGCCSLSSTSTSANLRAAAAASASNATHFSICGPSMLWEYTAQLPGEYAWIIVVPAMPPL
jgi:hypothetical protein